MSMRPIIVQLTRFGAVGIINTAVGLLAIYSVLFFFNANPILANLVGYAIGLVISFYLNKNWTFADNTSKSKVLPHYLILVTIAYLSNLGMVFIGMHFFNFGPYLVQLGGICIYTFIMFVGCKLYVFNRHKNY